MCDRLYVYLSKLIRNTNIFSLEQCGQEKQTFEWFGRASGLNFLHPIMVTRTYQQRLSQNAKSYQLSNIKCQIDVKYQMSKDIKNDIKIVSIVSKSYQNLSIFVKNVNIFTQREHLLHYHICDPILWNIQRISKIWKFLYWWPFHSLKPHNFCSIYACGISWKLNSINAWIICTISMLN